MFNLLTSIKIILAFWRNNKKNLNFTVRWHNFPEFKSFSSRYSNFVSRGWHTLSLFNPLTFFYPRLNPLTLYHCYISFFISLIEPPYFISLVEPPYFIPLLYLLLYIPGWTSLLYLIEPPYFISLLNLLTLYPWLNLLN